MSPPPNWGLSRRKLPAYAGAGMPHSVAREGHLMPPLTVLVAALAALHFPLVVSVTPNPMHYNHAGAAMTIHTRPGAICSGRVIYSTSHKAVSFKEQTVKTNGIIIWRWHEETKGTWGIATATCVLHRVRETITARFVVTH